MVVFFQKVLQTGPMPVAEPVGWGVAVSALSCMNATYVPKTLVVAVVLDDFALPLENDGSLPPYAIMAGIGPACRQNEILAIRGCSLLH